jgi:hypothetical protein
MRIGRIALVAAGLLIAAGAFILIVRGFSGPGAGPAAAGADARAAAAPGGGRGEDKAPPPRWQSFLRSDERTAPPRPVVRFARGLANPFDRLASGGGPGKPAPPGFRLEGISTGERPLALLSGHEVREGDTISGFRVARIGRSGVTLTGPGGTRFDLAREVPAGGGR